MSKFLYFGDPISNVFFKQGEKCRTCKLVTMKMQVVDFKLYKKQILIKNFFLEVF